MSNYTNCNNYNWFLPILFQEKEGKNQVPNLIANFKLLIN